MTIDMDLGTAIGLVITLVTAWWGMARLMFAQFEKRQDERFEALTKTLDAQKIELDAHMGRQDTVIHEIRRVETAAFGEIRRLETEIAKSKLDAFQNFQTKPEASAQHAEILTAIRALAARIDQLHGIKGGTP